jgi:hypothetical protein
LNEDFKKTKGEDAAIRENELIGAATGLFFSQGYHETSPCGILKAFGGKSHFTQCPNSPRYGRNAAMGLGKI